MSVGAASRAFVAVRRSNLNAAENGERGHKEHNMIATSGKGARGCCQGLRMMPCDLPGGAAATSQLLGRYRTRNSPRRGGAPPHPDHHVLPHTSRNIVRGGPSSVKPDSSHASCPSQADDRVSRAGIEPATLCLKGRCSTD